MRAPNGKVAVMADLGNNTLPQQIQQQYAQVHALQMAIYRQLDPAADTDLYRQKAVAEARLYELERQWKESRIKATRAEAPTKSGGRLLGPETTGLQVETKLLMQPLPTGIYTLLD